MTWQRAVAVWLALCCAVALTTPTWAQSSGAVRWQAEYWNNTTLAGAPAFTRTETAIDHNWGQGSPNSALIASDRFSARWQGTATLPAGRYRFTVTADDGARLWVDERLLIDAWTVQSAATLEAEVTSNGGPIPVRLEYFENTGEAVIQLTWSRLGVTPPDRADGGTEGAVGAPLNVWRGEYYPNATLSGEPARVRNDPAVNFDWGAGSPAADVPSERFSVRWTHTLNLPPGRYRFTATVDDGVRLWVDSRLIIDQWTVQSAQSFDATVDVLGGPTPIRMEYFENTGAALAQLTWSSTDSVPSPTGASTARMTGANFLNVRSGPGVRFGRINVLVRGEVVEPLGRQSDSPWVQIRLDDGSIGWVNGRYLTSILPLPELPVVP